MSRGEQTRTSRVVSKAGLSLSARPVFEKYQQLIHRLAPSFIRHVLERFRLRPLNAAQATSRLGISRSRLYALATAYNTARARKLLPLWMPGASGGDHATAWPQPVLDLLKKRLACTPPCPYSFAASGTKTFAGRLKSPSSGAAGSTNSCVAAMPCFSSITTSISALMTGPV